MQDSGRALHPIPRYRGKEPIIIDEVDANALVDGELSLGSSPPLGFSPAKNTRAKLCKRTSHRPAFSDAVSGASRLARKEAAKGHHQLDRAPDEALVLLVGVMQSMPFVHPAFGIGSTFYMPLVAQIRGLDDMLPSPLGQHILNYEPPRGFVIPAFAMFDDSIDPYDHMLHYNQAMILNANNDCLMCKVFPASLRGPALALSHKLPHNAGGQIHVATQTVMITSQATKGHKSFGKKSFESKEWQNRD